MISTRYLRRSNINGGNNSTKSGGQPNSGVGSNNGKWKSKITMLENKVRNQKRQLLDFDTAAKPGSDYKESDGSEKEYRNRKNSTLIYQGKSKRSKKA